MSLQFCFNLLKGFPAETLVGKTVINDHKTIKI